MKKIIGIIICIFLITTTGLSVAEINVNRDELNKNHTPNNFENPEPLNQVDEWPMYQHDVQHTGFSSSSAPDTNKVHWTFPTEAPIHYSSPAIANGKVYIGCEDGYLYCINTGTGELVWKNDTQDPDMKSSSPAIYQGNVYFTQPQNQLITCLNANTGSLVWEEPVGGRPAKSLTIFDDKLYFGANTDKIYCWDATTGSSIWDFTADGDINSFPAINNNKVFVGSTDGNLYCLNVNNGSKIWSYDTGGVVNSGPAVANGYVYFGSWSNYIYCLSEDTGVFIWKYLTDEHVSSSPAVAYDKIYATSWSTLYCIDAYSGDYIWSYTPNMGFIASPAVADGKVFIGDLDQYFFCFDAETGNIVWSNNLGWHFIISSPAVANDMVIVGHYDNLVYCFKDPNYPPDAPSIDGPSSGKTNVGYEYTFNSTDPEGDPVMYFIDWGDNNTDWTEYGDSGEEIILKHTWDEEGEYTIKAKAKDISDAESNWSYFDVEIPRTRASSYHWLFERFPLLERLLSFLLL